MFGRNYYKLDIASRFISKICRRLSTYRIYALTHLKIEDL